MRTRRSLPPNLVEPDGFRYCLNHQAIHEINEFGKNPIGRGGFMHSCRASIREYQRNITKKNNKKKAVAAPSESDIAAAIDSGDIKARKRTQTKTYPKDDLDLYFIPVPMRLNKETITRILTEHFRDKDYEVSL